MSQGKSASTLPFPPGMLLNCVTTRKENIRGNVVASDDNFGALVLKTKEGRSPGSMHVINLRYLIDITVLPSSSSEVRPAPPHLPVNLHKVRKRLEGSMEARKSQVQSLGVNVPPHAQQLFNRIRKIYSDTRWDGSVIVILGETRIAPPYTLDSISGTPKGTEMIRKLMKKSIVNGD